MANPPPPPPPPPAPGPPPIPVVAPSASPPPVEPRRSSAGLIAGCIIVGLVVLLGFGVGGYMAWSRLVAPHATTAAPPAVAPTAPAEVTETPAAPAEAPATPAATTTPAAPAATGTLDLDRFVGTWEFVGEPGPWGEGAPFTLERAGNMLVGSAGQPDWDDKTRLELTAGNDELRGESTTTPAEGTPESMALTMELEAEGGLLTVRFRGADGEWRTRVAKRVSGGAGAP